MRRALIPGSFDPPTAGHLDMIRRTAYLFDEVYVVVFDNSDKRKMFTAGERLELITLACAPLAGVKGLGRILPGLSEGMLSDYAAEYKIDVVIKGARNASDFDYEYWLSIINRSFYTAFETLIMPAKAEYQHISSTVVRELIKYGKPLSGYVPDEIIDFLNGRSFPEKQ
ncbi:MAG: pantetheine-phosphate adenylyltransferase [Eubacteriales bacterium]